MHTSLFFLVVVGLVAEPVVTQQDTGCVEIVTGGTVSKDDHFSSAECPGDQIVTNCECVMVDGGYCDGRTVTADGKTCRAHAGKNKDAVQAKACCGLADGEISVVTNPAIAADEDASITSKWNSYISAPSVECGDDTEVVACVAHSYAGATDYAGYTAPTIEGRACVTDDTCGQCAVQAICRKRQCETVEGEVVSQDDEYSTAACPADRIVRDCVCVMVDGGVCDGVTVTADGRTCRAHAGITRDATKARATCCEEQGDVEVVSVPAIVTDDSASIASKWAAYDAAPTATCPEGSHVLACFGHSYGTDANAVNKPTLENNECSLTEECVKCAAQAVCTSS